MKIENHLPPGPLGNQGFQLTKFVWSCQRNMIIGSETTACLAAYTVDHNNNIKLYIYMIYVRYSSNSYIHTFPDFNDNK